MALMHTIIPKAVNNHHNHVLSDPEAKSVECLTIKVHLAKDKPNPASAPYLKHEMILSTIKCRIELGTLFSLLCNLVCVNAFATLKMCVCIGSKYLQKIREKSLQNRAKRDFCNVFREFFANIEILYTHTFEVWQKHEHILNCIVAKTKYPVKSYT